MLRNTVPERLRGGHLQGREREKNIRSRETQRDSWEKKKALEKLSCYLLPDIRIEVRGDQEGQRDQRMLVMMMMMIGLTMRGDSVTQVQRTLNQSDQQTTPAASLFNSFSIFLCCQRRSLGFSFHGFYSCIFLSFRSTFDSMSVWAFVTSSVDVHFTFRLYIQRDCKSFLSKSCKSGRQDLSFLSFFFLSSFDWNTRHVHFFFTLLFLRRTLSLSIRDVSVSFLSLSLFSKTWRRGRVIDTRRFNELPSPSSSLTGP